MRTRREARLLRLRSKYLEPDSSSHREPSFCSGFSQSSDRRVQWAVGLTAVDRALTTTFTITTTIMIMIMYDVEWTCIRANTLVTTPMMTMFSSVHIMNLSAQPYMQTDAQIETDDDTPTDRRTRLMIAHRSTDVLRRVTINPTKGAPTGQRMPNINRGTTAAKWARAPSLFRLRGQTIARPILFAPHLFMRKYFTVDLLALH